MAQIAGAPPLGKRLDQLRQILPGLDRPDVENEALGQAVSLAHLRQSSLRRGPAETTARPLRARRGRGSGASPYTFTMSRFALSETVMIASARRAARSTSGRFSSTRRGGW